MWRYFVNVLLSVDPRWCCRVIARHRLKGSTASQLLVSSRHASIRSTYHAEVNGQDQVSLQQDFCRVESFADICRLEISSAALCYFRLVQFTEVSVTFHL